MAKKTRKKDSKKPSTARSGIVGKLQNFLPAGINFRDSSVAGSVALFRSSLSIFKNNAKVLGGLVLVYVVARMLIGGLPDQEVYQEAKGVTGELMSGNLAGVVGTGAVIAGAFSGLFTPAYNEVQQLLISIIGIIFWLCLIWSMRQILAGHSVTIRLALYNSMTPLIPLLVVVFILLLQLVPGALGAFLLSYLLSTSFSGIETVAFLIIAGLLLTLTLYLVVQSALALVIVTLPNTYPIAALKSAKLLVKDRRAMLLSRLLGLALLVAATWIAVALPFLLLENLAGSGLSIIPLIAEVLSGFSLAITTVYLYLLYRELL